ncbi:putative RiPP precursor [Mesorhizobium argentiipisi]|uniref:RiPP n=1 Tax=Mesorhizobium argentiipisi TaxID=3015175 RepID=A0ABU8KDB7_9HYPH
MKKLYEKPTLVKRQKLTERTAQIVASGVILGE